jgi:hypothetical protein
LSNDRPDVISVRTERAWQVGSTGLVLECLIRIPQQRKPSKKFFIIDVGGRSIEICFADVRPEGSEPKGVLCEQFRKRLPSSALTGVFRGEGDTLLVRLMGQGEEFHLTAGGTSPVSLSFEKPSESVSFARIGRSGSFSKVVTIQSQTISGVDQLPRLLSKMVDAKLPSEGTSSTPVQETTKATRSDASAGQALTEELQEAAQRTRRKIKVIKKSLGRLSSDMASDEKSKLLAEQVQWFQENIHLISAGLDAVDSSAFGGTVGVIELDPDLTLGKNLARMHEELKKSRSSQIHGAKVLANTQEDLQRWQGYLLRIEQGELPADVRHDLLRNPLQKKQDVKQKKAADADKLPYKSFHNVLGTEFRVARSAKDGDALTKQSKSNDCWVHVISGTGAHVIVPSRFADGGKLNARNARDAAILALHFSHLRKDMCGDVYVATRGNLKKTRSLAAGTWLVQRSDTLFVRYEADELRALLGGAGGADD